MSNHEHTQVHVRNGQRRWLHGTANCVTACAQSAPRSRKMISSTKTQRAHPRAWAKLRLGTASGYGVSLAQPQAGTSPTQLGTDGPEHLIVPWMMVDMGMTRMPTTEHKRTELL